ncbi:SUKH-4 family immunity protein [Streptomyces sp. NPDC005496]|uniref:SUKH-4 family immunity protein n=1 Tax=unclassified Streptomyces TaxID=2593676 RepID=UPI0033A0321F
MITTDTVVGGAIGPADEELDRYAARVPSWLPLTVGLPPSGATQRGPKTPSARKPRQATDLTDPLDTLDALGTLDRLAAELRNDLVTDPAHAYAYDRELESIVLEGPTGAGGMAGVTGGTGLTGMTEIPGELSVADFTDFTDSRRDAALTGPPLSAPSLEAVLRFTAATEELASVRGRSASLAGRFGPEAVERASAQLTAVFERSVGAGALPPFWTAAAVVRPLARIGGSEGGLVLELPRRLLDEEFGTGGIMRFEEVDFPPTLTHEPTRRFLRETGLPENGGVFQLDTEAPLRTLAEYCADQWPGDFPDEELPSGADRLIRLGHLTGAADLVVDGTTGVVLAWSDRDGALGPLNTDVSTLAFALWLLHRVRSLAPTQSLTDSYAHLTTTATPALTGADAVAGDRTPTDSGDDDRGHWPHIWQEGIGGGLWMWS